MPRCEGLPDGPCPFGRNDRSVVIGKGDLLLCTHCDTERRRLFDEARQASTPVSQAAVSVTTDSGDRRSASVDVRSSSRTKSVESTYVIQAPVIMCSTRLSDLNASLQIVWNELLAYVSYYRNQSTADALRRVVLGFFSPDDVSTAKKLLVKEMRSLDGVGQFITERRNSAVRPAHEAETDDILSIFDAADMQQTLDSFIFMASELNKLPKFAPEEVNLAAVVDRQVHVVGTIQALSTSVQQLTNTGGSLTTDVVQNMSRDVQEHLDNFKSAIAERVDHLAAVCSQLAENVTVHTPPSTATPDSRDGSMNIVVFGIAEDRSAANWRQKVDDALRFVLGHDVDVTDMYRVGRFAPDKVRPIVVKLRSAWDKRIILSSCYKLKDFDRQIFIAPDETLEARRKRMFSRLKSRAEREGQVVLVTNGVLSINGVQVFSMKDGKINNNGQ